MPELPEVETTRRGLVPHCVGATITRVKVREARLRWPIAADLPHAVAGQVIQRLERRGKYLVFQLSNGGAVLLHLGMSGRVHVVAADQPILRHDHVDFVLDSGKILRFHDPRRFGSLHYQASDLASHWLLRDLGPEPLADDFSGHYLWSMSRHRRIAVKPFIMDAKVVVGVGNIYATEALYRAGIHPGRAAGRIAKPRYLRLVAQIRAVLSQAIEIGGTTLRDFTNSQGDPGYFQQTLNAYGRGGLPCPRCGRALRSVRLGQRATVYCLGCQH